MDTSRLISLFVSWNDLARDLTQIEQIPTDKISAVTLSFNAPLRCGLNGTHIREAIQRFHNRGLKVIAFIGMEAAVGTWSTAAKARTCPICKETDEVSHTFDEGIQRDGTVILKGGPGGYPITTFLDSEWRRFIEHKVRMLWSFGVDYVVMGEDGWTMNRSLTPAFLMQFMADTGTRLPTAIPSPHLADYLAANRKIDSAITQYKFQWLFDWFKKSGVKLSGHSRWNKACPLMPGATIADFVGSFAANDLPTPETYAKVLTQINNYRVAGLLNMGQVQFAVGNTHTMTPYPEDVSNRINFLHYNGVDVVELYGSNLWYRYKEVI